MNLFEDLIEELKEENLIEDTIFELNGRSQEAFFANSGPGGFSESQNYALEQNDAQITDAAPVVGKAEFYRKLAMDEVASLQMVGQVFAGVEMEQMKSSADAYDDLEAKKALHRFLQVSGDPDSEEHLEAKKELLNETEAWNTALAVRDKNISVENLRHFCENSKPVLSSQALIAMARFYRNAAFSELVRSKFDYVMTRLFSRELGDGKRRLLFGRIEMVGHINTLYAQWSSLSVYSNEEYADLAREQVTGFSTYAAEAEAAAFLDEFLASNVFELIGQSKEQLADMFYMPEITAAAIDCNLRIGNKFVDVVLAERGLTETEAIVAKYGPAYDETVSTASARTLQLAEILKDTPESEETPDPLPKQQPAQKYEKAPRSEDERGLFSVNKWLLAATILIVAICIGIYFWAENYEGAQTIRNVAADVSLAGASFEKYVGNAKKTSETLYCVTNPAWDALDEKAQKEVLAEAVAFAAAKGATKVHFVNSEGRSVAHATQNKAHVYKY